MSDKNEDDLIDIEVEAQADDAGDDGAPAAVSPKDGIADLKRQLDAERAMRMEAERRAHAATVDKEDTDIQLVRSAIDTLGRENELARQRLQYAMQTGNFADQVAIQDEISEYKAKLLQLQNGLDAMQSKPKAAPPQMVPADPVEAFAARLTPRSADWVRSHPEFVRDPAKNRKMIAAHELAVADGIVPDTDAYFESIEATLRIKPAAVQAEEDASATAAKVVQRRDAAPAAAPVSRGQSSRNVVRLSAAEREMAEMMGMKPEEYARNKLALQNEGKM